MNPIQPNWLRADRLLLIRLMASQLLADSHHIGLCRFTVYRSDLDFLSDSWLDCQLLADSRCMYSELDLHRPVDSQSLNLFDFCSSCRSDQFPQYNVLMIKYAL